MVQDEALNSVAGLLLVACIFAVVGGYMDAYAYIAHGHVFATAQTGNVVFLGVYASGRDWVQAAHHLPPIGAFMLGVATARLVGAETNKHTFRATLICQALEAGVLLFLAVFAERLVDAWVVPLIAFCSALQSTSFGALGPWTFDSAMTTGNLRNGTSGLVLWLMGRKPEENRNRAIVSSLVFASFAIGACLGGLYTRFDGKHSLAPCIPLVLVGLVLTWRQRIRYQRRDHQFLLVNS